MNAGEEAYFTVELDRLASGLGGGLYKPGQTAAATLDKARAYVAGVQRR